MQGLAGLRAQSCYVSQSMRAPLGMYGQSMSGNKKATAITANFIKHFLPGASGILSSFGIQAGDLMVYSSMNAGPPGTLATATSLGSDGAMQHFYKIVDAVDVASSFSFVALTLVSFFRGPKASQRIGSFSGTTGPWCGFTKNAYHMGIVGFMYSNSGGGGSYNPDTAGASFAQRGGTFSSPYDMFCWDRLSPPNSAYLSGQTFNFNFSPSSMITGIELLSQ